MTQKKTNKKITVSRATTRRETTYPTSGKNTPEEELNHCLIFVVATSHKWSASSNCSSVGRLTVIVCWTTHCNCLMCVLVLDDALLLPHFLILIQKEKTRKVWLPLYFVAKIYIRKKQRKQQENFGYLCLLLCFSLIWILSKGDAQKPPICTVCICTLSNVLQWSSYCIVADPRPICIKLKE